jgi:hypothetical protein
MAKFNTTGTRPNVASAVVSESIPSGVTYEGAPGYARDAKSELFLLAVANMVGEHTFYETAEGRDGRYVALVHQTAVTDPEWTAAFVGWLRGEGNMRSAALVAAAEFVAARLISGNADGVSGRRVVDSVLQRADEPGEMLAYWTSRYGRTIPKPIKRGVADAAVRLYTERSLLKYDAATRGFRFGDVLELTHPSPSHDWQGDLFRHALDRRHNRDNPIPESLELLRARAALMAVPVEDRRGALDPDRLQAAGMTWEALAGWLHGPLDAATWTAIIPSMGFMALLRNVRNFDEAGVSDEVAATVAARLADPAEVARSRQLPLRFLSAYRAAPSLRWGQALETALGHSLANVPALPGRTLVLVDRSGSMWCRLSARSELNRADAAALFGSALALRAEQADLVEFGTDSRPVTLRPGTSVLRSVEQFSSMGGTNTATAVRANFRGHDRVVIVTDEQAWAGRDGAEPTKAVPSDVPVYTWNLAGYRYGHGPSGGFNRHTFGGLSDAAFGMIPLMEASGWPF